MLTIHISNARRSSLFTYEIDLSNALNQRTDVIRPNRSGGFSTLVAGVFATQADAVLDAAVRMTTQEYKDAYDQAVKRLDIARENTPEW